MSRRSAGLRAPRARLLPAGGERRSGAKNKRLTEVSAVGPSELFKRPKKKIEEKEEEGKACKVEAAQHMRIQGSFKTFNQTHSNN